MAADLASGPSAIVDSREWSYANLDLTIYLTRSPIGEWIFAESETMSAGDGTAVVNSRLGDRTGYIGITNQVLYMARRPPRPAVQ
jgi:acyl-CoA thioesterase